jgi:2'-5' RNA ligase
MRRSLVLFPVFSGAAQIDALRSAFDPLATKIPPHVTLVFPFDSYLSAEEVAVHAEKAVSSVESFSIRLGEAQAREDFIWLPVVHGRGQIIALHDALYSGLLSDYLDCARTFEPHVTVARLQSSDFRRAHRAALALRGPFETIVDRLVIEAITSDEASHAESVIDFGKKSDQALEPTREAHL